MIKFKRLKWKARVSSLLIGLLVIVLAWHFLTSSYINNQINNQVELEELQFSNDMLTLMATVNQQMLQHQMMMTRLKEQFYSKSGKLDNIDVEGFGERLNSIIGDDEAVEVIVVSSKSKITATYPNTYNNLIGTTLSDFLGRSLMNIEKESTVIDLGNEKYGLAFSEHMLATDGYSNRMTVVFNLDSLLNQLIQQLSPVYNFCIKFDNVSLRSSEIAFDPSRPVYTDTITLANKEVIIQGQLRDKMVSSTDDLTKIIRIGSLLLILVTYLSIVFLLYSNNFLSGRVNEMVFYDSLTRLPNRRKLNKDMKTLVRRSDDFSIFFIDVFNFKAINDSRGHKKGDEILRLIGMGLNQHANEDVKFYRWGGDEFIGVINMDIYDSTALLKSILDVVKNSIVDINGARHQIEFTAGGATYVEADRDVDQTLLNADYAMQELRKENERGVKIYNEEIGSQLKRRIHVESMLHEAIAQGDFKVVFQPLVNPDGRVASLEALVRWSLNDEKIYPDEFIPIAEQLNVIDKLDLIVIDKALEGVRRIQDAGYKDVRVGVNVSISELDESFIEAITEFMENHGVGPNSLIIEITERIDLVGEDYRLEILEKLRDAGVVIALDDFGSGFSSMMRLVNMPFDKIKIDKGLIDYCALETSKNIVGNIIDMIHVMDMTAVAEGVETKDQVEALKKYGVDFIQGYYYSRPLEIVDAIAFIDAVQEE